MANSTNWGAARFTITKPDGITFTIVAKGRDRWALECLIVAGSEGCAPIETPGPRWSGYIFNLRQLGLDMETITEPHFGPFAGTHALYLLRCKVQRQTLGADS